MCKRSLRKVRHHTDKVQLSFADRVKKGQYARDLFMGKINYNQIPEKYRDVEVKVKTVQDGVPSAPEEHVHSESCSHNH